MKGNSGSSMLSLTEVSKNQMLVDIQVSCANGLQLKDLATSVDEHVPKVRKPYTITKQREKWTEEEHDKFLEALKLYGRAWRRIEEHIGTKTAVQIRSHAQKFFTKVVRESGSSNMTTVNSIEIPPPRPKRKPMHPYPRKLGIPSTKGIQGPERPSWSISANPALPEQEKGSPTSVISAIGSDASGSSGPNSPIRCTSPLFSASGSDPDGSFNEQENGSGLCSLSTEKQGTPMIGSVCAKLTADDTSVMELDSGIDDAFLSKEGFSEQTQGTSLKLFGKTVMISDHQKPLSPVAENKVQIIKSSPADDNGSHQQSTGIDPENSDQALHNNAWNPWVVGMPHPMFFCSHLPIHPIHSADASSLPLPLWWPFSGGLPFPDFNSEENSPKYQAEAPDRIEAQKESSWSGSDTSSGSEVVDSQIAIDLKEETELVSTSKLKPSVNSAFRTLNSGIKISSKGFSPYKRCTSLNEVQHQQHPQMVSEEEYGGRVELCL
ncbi:uncharacterized protein LOC120272068 isoform X1 [Dioscorea cayenensis subsp. rotundata]|uniref:Uncharacterized protein LOC120272068 isoform X1 n=2 Tax=Dioscorea cayennensis subsp. rotundata TaxID=55577 RepID=A0AB40C5W1_DIOCR|nr:uncharacterized protein LOC120272068 isoform X1 [Dioscorea cayenensis subsp. rotundata]